MRARPTIKNCSYNTAAFREALEQWADEAQVSLNAGDYLIAKQKEEILELEGKVKALAKISDMQEKKIKELKGLLKMDKIELDAKPLSWWLGNAVTRVEKGAIDRTKEGMLRVYNTWKNMSLLQEQQTKELKELLIEILDFDEITNIDSTDNYKDGAVDLVLKIKQALK